MIRSLLFLGGFVFLYLVAAFFFMPDYLRLYIVVEGKGEVLPVDKVLYVGRYNKGQLTARPLPNTGHGFREWKGDVHTLTPEVVVDMGVQSRSVSAVFSDSPAPGTSFQQVTIQCAGPGSGTTDPPPGDWIFRNDIEEKFIALPDEGSFFGGWQIFVEDEKGELIEDSPDSPFPFYTLPSGKNLTALAWFHTKGGRITLETRGEGYFAVPEGNYALAYGTEALLRVGATDGSYLLGVQDESGAVVFTPDNQQWGDFSFQVTEDQQYTALFEPLEKEISLRVDAEAPVSGQIRSLLTAAASTLHADYGTTLQLQAEALNSNSAFSHWSGTALKEPVHDPLLLFNVEENAALTAHFVPASTFLDLEVDVDGSMETLPSDMLSPAPGRHGFSGTAQARAKLDAPLAADKELAFLHWQGDLPDDASPTDRQLLLPMDQSRSIRACFTRHKLCTLTIEKEQGARGTLFPAPGTYHVAPGTQLKLQATPEKERTFGGWKIRHGEEETLYALETVLPLTIHDNTRVSAFFGKSACHITIKSSHPDAIIHPEPGIYTPAPGAVIELKAQPPESLAFHYWHSYRDGILSYDPLFHTTLKDTDVFTASFGRPLQRLHISVEGGGHIKRDFEEIDRFERGSLVQLEACPDSDTRFVGWEGDLPDNALPSQPRISVVMDEDVHLAARFAPAESLLHIVEKAPDDAEGIQILPGTGTKGYFTEDRVTLLALPPPDSDIVFTGWEGDIASPDPAHTLIMEKSMHLTACFARKEEVESVSLTILPVEGTGVAYIRHFPPGRYLFSPDALLYLTTILSDDSYFGGWVGQVEQDIVYTNKALRLDKDKTVGIQATRAGMQFVLLLDSTETGELNPPPGVYRLAENMQVSVQAFRINNEFSFAGWYDNSGNLLSRLGKYQFTVAPGMSRKEVVGVFRKHILPPPLVFCQFKAFNTGVQ